MTVLVTGHRGFIGGAVHTRLIENQEDFIAYDIADHQKTTMEMVPKIPEDLEIDKIYHIGAVAGIEACEQRRDSSYLLNTVATHYWADVALAKEAHLIFTSSMAAASVTPTWYGLTKRHAEDILLQYRRRYGLKLTILRLPNIYGHGSIHKNSVVARMCKDALANKGIYIHGDGKQTRSFMHIDDTANMILEVNREGIYRVQGRTMTIRHLADDLAKKFDVPTFNTKARADSLLPVDVSDSVPRDMQYVPEVDFEKRMDDTVKYFKQQWDLIKKDTANLNIH